MNINEQANVQVNLNGKQAEEDLKQLRKQAREVRKELKQLKLSGDKQGFEQKKKELTTLENQMAQLKKQSLDVTQVLRNLNGTSLKKLQAAHRQLTAEVRKFDDRSSKAYKDKVKQLKMLDVELKKVRAEMKASTSRADRLANTFNKWFSAITFGFATVMGLVLGIRKLTNVLMDFEKTLTNVYTLLSEDDFEKFHEKLEKGSIEIIKKYGFTIEDTNKALFDTISAGVDAGSSIDVLNESARLAIGGVTQLSVATDGLTTILNAYHLEMDQASNVADAYFTAQKYGKTTVAELASNIGKVAPVAAMADVSFQELLTSVAALTKGGISTEESVTYVKNALVSLMDPADKAREIFQKFNQTHKDLQIPMSTSELRTIGLGNALKGLNQLIQEQPDVIAEAIPNIRGLMAVTALTGEGLEEYDEILQAVNNDIGENSSLTQAFAKQQETLAQQMARAKGELTSMVLELKEELTPVLVGTIKGISSFSHLTIKSIKFLKDHKESVKALVKVVSILAAGYGAYRIAMWTTNKEGKIALLLQSGLASAKKIHALATGLLTGKISLQAAATRVATAAQTAFNLTNPVGWINIAIGAIAGLTTAYFAFRDEVDENTESLEDFGNELDEINAKIGKMLHGTLTMSMEMDEDGAFDIVDISSQFGESIKKVSTTDLQSLKMYLEEEVGNLARSLANATSDATAKSLSSTLKEYQNHLSLVNKELDKLNPKQKKKSGKPATTTSYSDAEPIEDPEPELEDWMADTDYYEDEMVKFWKSLGLQKLEITNDTLSAEVLATADAEEKKRKIEEKAYRERLENIEYYSAMTGSIIGESLALQEDQYKDFGRNVIVMALSELQRMVPIWVAKITGISLAQPDSVATFGASGVARAAILTGLLNGAISFAKTKAGGYATGGPIPSKELAWVGEQGPEYMIPNDGLQNPQLSSIINMIETARVAGSLRTFDFTKATQAVSFPGYAAGGFAPASGAPTPPVPSPADPEMKALMSAILNRLNNPVPSNAYMSYDYLKNETERMESIEGRTSM